MITNKIVTIEEVQTIVVNFMKEEQNENFDIEEVSVCEFDNGIFEINVNGYEYIISNNYDRLEEEAIQDTINIIEDCGLTQNLIDEAYIKGWIDEEYFKDYWEDLHEFQAYNEDIQYIATEEELEQLENGDITEDDIRDNYYNCLKDSLSGNYIDEYKFQFGDEEFQRVLLRENLIDIEEVAKWCVEMDGVAHTLATWDGEEIEYNGFYFYQR